MKELLPPIPSESDAWEWACIFYGALKELVELKHIKDSEGKTDDYLERQPKAWYLANSALELWKKSDYGAISIKSQLVVKEAMIELWKKRLSDCEKMYADMHREGEEK